MVSFGETLPLSAIHQVARDIEVAAINLHSVKKIKN